MKFLDVYVWTDTKGVMMDNKKKIYIDDNAIFADDEVIGCYEIYSNIDKGFIYFNDINWLFKFIEFLKNECDNM